MAHHHHEHECCSNHCHHEHEHHHEHGHHHEHDTKRQLWLIVITAVLLAAAVVVEHTVQLSTWQLLLVYLVPYLLVGHDTLREAVEGLAHGEPFNEHLLMSVATIGALAIGFMPGAENEFPEAVFVMLFFQVGELFEGYAEGKSRQSIAHLMDIRPDVVHVVAETSKLCHNTSGEVEASKLCHDLTDLPPSEVPVGSVIVVRPGERIPIDGIIIDGATTLNTSALTGESLPRDAQTGDEVVSGCVNLSGLIRVRTTKSFGESTVSKIIELVEHSGEHKSRSETFISRFARVYTPVVVVAAIVIAIVPPLLSSFFFHLSFTQALTTWVYRALMFLVVSCPCALVLSVPLTFFGGIGGASRRGILIKGANYIDVLSKVGIVALDKTGTLTKGQFSVTAVHPDEFDEHQLLHLAAHVEHFSTHPIGAALRDAFPDEATDGCAITDVEEMAGMGLRANVAGRMVYVGNSRLMDSLGVQWHDCTHHGTIIHVAATSPLSHVSPQYIGHIVINDQVKADSAEAVASLKTLGVERIVMLTGDRPDVAEAVATQLGITEYAAELFPADKVKYVVGLVGDASKRSSHGEALAFVGDGINDAPVLASADVGIAMGGLGSDAAIEAADVVIMDDSPSKIALAIAISRRTLAIARQNVWFAIGVKVAVLVLAAFGLATMWMAVFADVGVTVLAVLNAMRALENHTFTREDSELETI